MNIVLIVAIIVLIGLVAYSLIRGLVAFIQTTEADLKNPGASKGQQLQNKMMFNRVKYQALAVLAIAILLMFNQ